MARKKYRVAYTTRDSETGDVSGTNEFYLPYGVKGFSNIVRLQLDMALLGKGLGVSGVWDLTLYDEQGNKYLVKEEGVRLVDDRGLPLHGLENKVKGDAQTELFPLGRIIKDKDATVSQK